MNNKIQPVILAGGGGSRLWPISRQSRPKPFNKIISDTSMLHSTLKRLNGMDTNQIIIVTNDNHKFFVKSLVEETNSNAKLIIEPCGRNTAPAIAAAANIAEKDSMLLVLPADHLIESVDGFQEMVNNVKNSSCEI